MQFRKTFETFNTFFPSLARIFEIPGTDSPYLECRIGQCLKLKVLMISFTGEDPTWEGMEEEGSSYLKPRLASPRSLTSSTSRANNFPKFFFFLLFQRTEIKNDFLPREKKNGTCILINREMFLRKIQQLARVSVTTFESSKFWRHRTRKVGQSWKIQKNFKH